MNRFTQNNILLLFFLISIGALFYVRLSKEKFVNEQYINLCERIVTWMKIIVILYISTINNLILLCLFSLISYISLKEFFQIFKIKFTKKIRIISLVIILINYFLVYKNYVLLYLMFVPCVLTILKVLKKIKKEIIISMLVSIYSMGMITFLINTKFGIKGIVTYLIIIELNDIYQYIIGKLFGKNKIVPKISPNKTREGLIGGVILTSITTILFKVFYINNIYIWSGIMIAILGFLGDVFISYFKRQNKIKDTGYILKGHGGILDRIDSLIFNSPFILLLSLL